MNWLKPSDLNGVILKEDIDVSILRKILVLNNQLRNEVLPILTDDEEKKVKRLIREYGMRETIDVKYNFGKDKKFGRVWARFSASNLWNRIKATISGDKYIDIDMVNSGTMLIVQIAGKMALTEEIFSITGYLANRDEYINDVMKTYTVGKALAKDLFIIMNFGGNVYTWMKKHTLEFYGEHCKFLRTYKAQIKMIADRLCDSFPEIKNQITIDENSDNANGKVLAEVVQNIECQCLSVLYNKLGRPEFCRLEHDGLCINKKELQYVEKPIIELLKEVEKETLDKIYFNVKWDVKPFKEPLPIEDINLNPDNNFSNFDYQYFDELMTYEEKKQYFEIFIAFVVKPIPRYIFVEYQHSTNKLVYDIWTKDNIKNTFEAYKFIGKKEAGGKLNKEMVEVEKVFITEWLADTKKRISNDFDFIPENRIESPLTYWSGANEQVYNSYNGYHISAKAKMNLTQRQKDAILKPWQSITFAVCGENDECYNAYIDFLAHMIQKPNEKMPVCFILQGDQGTGKSYHLKPLQKLLHDYFISSSDINDFIGKSHANGFYRKILINLNECQMDANSFKYEGQIKSFITEDTITLDEKYEKMKTVRNIARVVITTQKPNPVPIDVKTYLRRFQVFKSTNKYKDRPASWWKKENDRVMTDEFIATLYEFLNTRDISKINITKAIMTPQYIEMCKHFIPPEVLFLEYFLQLDKASNDCECNIKYLEWDNDNKYKCWKISANKLYKMYEVFCETHGVKREVVLTQNKFTLNLTNLNIGILSIKKGGDKYMTMDAKELKTNLIKRNLMIADEEDEVIEEEHVDATDFADEFEDYENITD